MHLTSRQQDIIVLQPGLEVIKHELVFLRCFYKYIKVIRSVMYLAHVHCICAFLLSADGM